MSASISASIWNMRAAATAPAPPATSSSKKGDDNLSEMDDDEADRLDMAPGLTLRSRFGCQCVVKGDVVVEIPTWNRNYVSEGGGSMNLGNAIPAAQH